MHFDHKQKGGDNKWHEAWDNMHDMLILLLRVNEITLNASLRYFRWLAGADPGFDQGGAPRS